MADRKLKIIYRSNSHAPFWLVADKSGSWQKNSLSVDTSPQLVREKAVEALNAKSQIPKYGICNLGCEISER